MKLSNWLGLGAVALTSVSATMVQAQGVDPEPEPATGGIYNEATVTGYYGGTTEADKVTAEDDERVPVAEAVPDLSVTKTAGAPSILLGANTDRTDASDTITYTFVVKNEGNVTMTGVTPVDTGPTFNGEDGTGTLSAFTVVGGTDTTATLAPGEEATFTAVYTLSEVDVYRAADTAALVGDAKKLVANTAASSGLAPSQTVAYVDPDTDDASTEITPFPQIGLVKLATLDDTNGTIAGRAEKDEVITYTYTVTNSGNVPLTGVTVADVHEGAALTSGTDIKSEALSSDGALATATPAVTSSDAADDGIWDTLQPGATVVFTYVHTATQTEVDGG